jgi:hypothetical protein
MANTTWNPSDKSAGVTLTGSNLIATNTAAAALCRARHRQAGGHRKFYWNAPVTHSDDDLRGRRHSPNVVFASAAYTPGLETWSRSIRREYLCRWHGSLPSLGAAGGWQCGLYRGRRRARLICSARRGVATGTLRDGKPRDRVGGVQSPMGGGIRFFLPSI